MKNLTIAIDGPSGAGKSTIAKELAKSLGISYVDTGAMYRAIAYTVLKDNIDQNNDSAIQELLDSLTLDFQEDGHIVVNGTDVEHEIRREEISKLASQLSQKDYLRRFLVTQQQEIGKSQSVVMEGRDIGTVVLKDASVKFYLTASEEVRGLRRWKQLQEKDSSVQLEEVLEDIKNRDYHDMNRKYSPLKKAKDAIVFDNSTLTLDETIAGMKEIIRSKGYDV